MSDQNTKGKTKYESPVIVPLGEMAKGAGACTTGSGYSGACVYNPGGDAPYGVATCSAGVKPDNYCSAGTTATAISASYCSAGTTASDYCSAGNCAPGSAGYCTSSGTDAGAACTTSGTTAGS
jgi:hypothetical protein